MPKPINRILISQPKPVNPNSPYFKLEKKYGIHIDFQSFIEIKVITIEEFFDQEINILDYTAVIFTSRRAIKHFFTIYKKVKITIPANIKYFCLSEQVANYLQKYTIVKEKRIFFGYKTAKGLIEILEKYSMEKFLFPCSDIRRNEIPNFFTKKNYQFKELIIYHTIASDLSNITIINYDMLVFFSPSGVNSLFKNFPSFKQRAIKIAALGPTTAKAIKEKNLSLHVESSLPNTISMVDAIESYMKKVNSVS